jgi:alpha-methylacyl-CoA racemase
LSAQGRRGPLAGLRIVEMAGIGPAPMCGMLLADLGAEVVRVARPGNPGGNIRVPPRYTISNRGKTLIEIDLKQSVGVDAALALIERSDALIEGFRPGVMERLGLGPETCLARNPKLVFGRMTGFGQDGPLSTEPSHDLNILGMTGVLNAIGPSGGPPVIPLNLIADFGGGALYLAFGVVAALWEAQRSGRGQCVDASMLEGVNSLVGFLHGLTAAGAWTDSRASNALDGGAHFYNVYETADGRHISIAANEPEFYRKLLELLGIDPHQQPPQRDRDSWPRMRELFRSLFRRHTFAQWCERLESAGVCFAPVLSLAEAPAHPHAVARGLFIELDGVTQPAPTPRFSRTEAGRPRAASSSPSGREVLQSWGVPAAAVSAFLETGAVR